MLRLKRINGGELNVPAYKILAFINKNGGSEIVLDGLLSYEVKETPLSIRNAINKLNKVSDAD